jgi:hypothetical protein
MQSLLFGLSSEVIQISEDDARNIMENIGHGPLKCSTCILESKRHDAIRKCIQRGCKRSFALICWMDLNLVIAREPIHKGKCLMDDTIIDNLVNKIGWEVVFGTSMVEIMKVCVDTNNSLFFVHRDGVGDPQSVRNGVNESRSA